ncbi:MAG: EAL domain-containing protein [Burkholderiales bacterium]|nr:EAL domain-containing protein [Burkholderiales bacterium]
MAKILVVDDVADNRLLVVTLVASQGHQPLEAGDGAEALSVIRQERPDLVISDVLMPTMDGYELVRRLREDPGLAATQVVFYSAHYREREARNLARACGVSHVLVKPCEPQDILDTIEQALTHPDEPVAPATAQGFDNEHLRLMTDTLSEKAQELEAANRRLAALTDLNLQLASERSPVVLLEKLCRSARDLIGAQYAVMCATGKGKGNGSPVFSTSGIDSAVVQQLPVPALDGGLLGQTRAQRQAQRITTTDGDATAVGLPAGYPPLFSGLMAPVTSLSHAYGWICLANKMGAEAFSAEDERILAILSAQTGRIYENGSLYAEVQDHAERLQREIAERKQAANKLRTSEASLHHAQVLAKLTHVITGPGGVFESWPPTLPQMIGVDPGHMVQNTRQWLDLVHPDDRALFRRTAIVAGIDGTRHELVYRLRRTDDRWLHIRQVMEPDHDTPDHNGEGHWFHTLQDISDQKRAQDALRESDRRFSELLDNVDLVSVMLDTQGRITYCNNFLLRLTDWRREDILGGDWFALFIPPEHRGVKAKFLELLARGHSAGHFENEILTRSGMRRLIRWSNTVLYAASGETTGTASIGEDITDRAEAETKIRRLNRVYAVLGGINTLIVRARSRDELFRQACRIAVEHGRFKMAWIGAVDNEAQLIRPMASAGTDPEYLALIKDCFVLDEEVPTANKLCVRAVREKHVVVNNDIRLEPQPIFARERMERGILSMAFLPLFIMDNVVGVLALYSAEPVFFDAEELKLLTELTSDIGFALDHLDKAERLQYLAYYDEVTGLPNRSLLLERVGQVLRVRDTSKAMAALALVDVDRFRNVNDTLDRRAGDELLKLVAQRLQSSAIAHDTVARVGANCFAVVMHDPRDAGNVALNVEQVLRDCFAKPFQLRGSDLRIAGRAGIALYPVDGEDAEALFRNAEAALKRAKGLAESMLFYAPEMNTRVAEALNLESRLRTALDLNQFVLHYQPKISLTTGELTGIEALIRWNDPLNGLVPPAQFIPVLEETGLIYEVGQWALRQALNDNLRWRAARLSPVRIAVNVSPLQLRHRGFVDEVRKAVALDPQAAAGLELEITESLIMEDVNRNIISLNEIRALGVTIAIDDFGTGFSSLSYLAKLPVDTLKIDRSFVIDMTVGPEGLALVSTIISLAHALKLKVVAEGVETEEQARLLRLLNCDEMQGYLFSRPVPAEVLESQHLSPRLSGKNSP